MLLRLRLLWRLLSWNLLRGRRMLLRMGRRVLILHRPGGLSVRVCELEALRWRILLDDYTPVNGRRERYDGTIYLHPACCGFMAVVETALTVLAALYRRRGRGGSRRVC